MPKKRDYKAEYQRRIQRASEKGFSRAQARGHPKAGEKPISKVVAKRAYNPRLEEGLKAVRKGKSVNKAAKSVRASPKTLKKYIESTGVRTRKSA
jgi:hypothetical protein